MGKLVNRIPDSRFLISGLQGSALRKHVESLMMSTSVLKALPGKLKSNDTQLVFSIARQASR